MTAGQNNGRQFLTLAGQAFRTVQRWAKPLRPCFPIECTGLSWTPWLIRANTGEERKLFEEVERSNNRLIIPLGLSLNFPMSTKLSRAFVLSA